MYCRIRRTLPYRRTQACQIQVAGGPIDAESIDAIASTGTIFTYQAVNHLEELKVPAPARNDIAAYKLVGIAGRIPFVNEVLAVGKRKFLLHPLFIDKFKR
jgi:hypothetical protein